MSEGNLGFAATWYGKRRITKWMRLTVEEVDPGVKGVADEGTSAL